MSIAANFFHTLKTDNRVSYGALAGLTLGFMLDGQGDRLILRANKNGREDIQTNLQFKLFCEIGAFLSAILAYRRESQALAAVAALGMVGSLWFNRQISLINNNKNADSPSKEHSIQRAVNFNYIGIALQWAVPVTVFSWHVIQSYKGR